MAHNIFNDGTKDCMFVVGKREDAWHRLGQRVPGAVNWEQAIELAGLNWNVVKQQNFAMIPGGRKLVATDSYTVFRDSDNAQLGTVGIDYAVMQNADCFRFVDTLLEANGGSHYDSAGALGNGARIWCAVRVPGADFNVAGPKDAHETYLIFTTSHDGSKSHTAMLSSVRVVCQNTLQAALRESEAMFRVRHTANAQNRLIEVKSLMSGVVQNAQTLKEKLERLAHRRMTKETLVEVINRLFPVKNADAKQTKRENTLIQVLDLYASNDNNAIPEIAGTGYNLLNAMTEWTDHHKNARITQGRKGMTVDAARAENAVSGTGENFKNQALAVIDEVTEAAETGGQLETVGNGVTSPMDDESFLKAIGIAI